MLSGNRDGPSLGLGLITLFVELRLQILKQP